MKKKRYCLVCIMLLGGIFPLSAQSNEMLDELLSEESVSFGNAVYIVLAGAGLIGEGVSVEEAVGILLEQQWGIKGKSPEEPIHLDEYSFLLMKALMKGGGLMYTLFPSPRYAYRELDYRGLIEQPADPGRTVSGEEALRMLAGVLALKEDEG
ncbi:MAG: hypothetical protein JW881_11970 [Spirochaetales bacterium]|nr:hypothetical protein [Spirochaetales bacterium]